MTTDGIQAAHPTLDVPATHLEPKLIETPTAAKQVFGPDTEQISLEPSEHAPEAQRPQTVEAIEPAPTEEILEPIWETPPKGGHTPFFEAPGPVPPEPEIPEEPIAQVDFQPTEPIEPSQPNPESTPANDTTEPIPDPIANPEPSAPLIDEHLGRLYERKEVIAFLAPRAETSIIRAAKDYRELYPTPGLNLEMYEGELLHLIQALKHKEKRKNLTLKSCIQHTADTLQEFQNPLLNRPLNQDLATLEQIDIILENEPASATPTANPAPPNPTPFPNAPPEPTFTPNTNPTTPATIPATTATTTKAVPTAPPAADAQTTNKPPAPAPQAVKSPAIPASVPIEIASILREYREQMLIKRQEDDRFDADLLKRLQRIERVMGSIEQDLTDDRDYVQALLTGINDQRRRIDKLIKALNAFFKFLSPKLKINPPTLPPHSVENSKDKTADKTAEKTAEKTPTKSQTTKTGDP